MTADLTHDFPKTLAVIEEGIARGEHSGVQLYVSSKQQPLIDTGIGMDSESRPLTRDSINLWLSAGKPLTAVMILQLVDEGQLSLHSPVVDVIPEFGRYGKEAMTIWHLLTHTSGIRKVEIGWPDASWDEILDRICETPIEEDWVLGETAGYHLSSSWFVLGEIIQRLDKCHFPESIQRRICQPLGLESTTNGMTRDEYQQSRDRLAKMYQVVKGELSEQPWQEESYCIACVPGATARGPIRELGRFYESFLTTESVVEAQKQTSATRVPALLSPAMRAEFVRRQRVDRFDETLRHKVDFGLGVIINSNCYGADTVPYAYGSATSDTAFGHGGSQSSIGFCDPERGVVVCYVANTRIGEPRHQRRNRALVNAINLDLKLLGIG